MANRMVKKSSARVYGKSGEATIVKLDSGKVRIDFLKDDSNVVLVPVQGDVFEENSTANVPDFVPLKRMKVDDKKGVRVAMNEDNTKILYINPLNGEQTVKFVGFQSNGKDVPPTMTSLIKTGDNGQYTSVEFYSFLEIMEGAWKGCKLRATLYDKFGADDAGNMVIFGTKKWSEKLMDFCDCIGVDLEAIKYSENPLPEIQKIALENENIFQVNLLKGYVQDYIKPLGSDDYLEDDYVEPDAFEQKEEIHKALQDEE